MFSDFFVKSEAVGSKESMPTILQVIEPDEKTGESRSKVIELESSLSPIGLLDYSDYRISVLLRNGIEPKSLAISKDLRLGFDSEFNDLNNRIESIASNLFVQPKSK